MPFEGPLLMARTAAPEGGQGPVGAGAPAHPDFGGGTRVHSRRRRAGATAVLIVHHADIDLPVDPQSAPDPDLNEAGRARAQGLARTLGDTDVDAIFSSTYARCMQTAEPLAARVGLPLEVRLPTPTAPLAREIRTRYAGGTVVVISDATAIPSLVEDLGGMPGTGVDVHDFDTLVAVSRPRFGRPSVLRLRYGQGR